MITEKCFVCNSNLYTTVAHASKEAKCKNNCTNILYFDFSTSDHKSNLATKFLNVKLFFPNKSILSYFKMFGPQETCITGEFIDKKILRFFDFTDINKLQSQLKHYKETLVFE